MNVVICAAYFALLARCVYATCPTGCSDGWAPAIDVDGRVWRNRCIADCQGATLSPGAPAAVGAAAAAAEGEPAQGSRTASEKVILRHAEGFNFLGFAQTKRLTAQLGGATSDSKSSAGLSLAALQQLVKANSVVRYDISTGAVYASQAAAALPGLPKSVKYPAQRPRAQPPQPGTQPDEPSTSPSPSLPPGPSSADDDEDSDGDKDSSGELEQNPDILVDTTPSTTSAHNSPSPNPGPSDASPAPTEAPAQPGGSSSSSTAGSGGQGMGRRLRFVQPVDERKLVQTLPAFPLSPVGQLLSHGQEWHCTATLIAERTIITAAHCVFDRFSGSWARGLYFVPSRYRDGAGNIQAPVGSAYVSEIFIMGDYITGDPRDQWVGDMAIAVLPPNTVFGGAVGHLGYEAGGSKPEAAVTATATAASEDASSIAGWVQNPTAVAAAAAGASSSSTGRVILQRSRRLLSPSPSPSPSTEPPRSSWMQEVLDTAGYPSDLGEGALVHTSCLATSEPGSIGQSATYKLQKCSTAFGQSGSPLFDADGNIRGVVSFEIQGKNGFNGGCALTPYLWANLVAPYLA